MEEEVKRPIVQKLLQLMKFRNEHPAFGGSFLMTECGRNELVIRREMGKEWTELRADFEKRSFEILYTEKGKIKKEIF